MTSRPQLIEIDTARKVGTIQSDAVAPRLLHLIDQRCYLAAQYIIYRESTDRDPRIDTPRYCRSAKAAGSAYAFERNYPNPFNPTTMLRFALPVQTHVELSVYNLNGQLVNRLVNETRLPGIHQVTWDARDLASGTYFVRLSTPAFTRVQKVMLLK